MDNKHFEVPNLKNSPQVIVIFTIALSKSKEKPGVFCYWHSLCFNIINQIATAKQYILNFVIYLFVM